MTLKRMMEILSQLANLREIRLHWRPDPADVVIWDSPMEPVIKASLPTDFRVEFLRVRGEEIYVYPLLKALIDSKLRSQALSIRYSFHFTMQAGARLIITGHDNSPTFYLLCRLLKQSGVKSIAVQNARRFLARDLASTPARPNSAHVDYLFCFGEAIAKRFEPWIGDGEIIPFGSLKSNLLVHLGVLPGKAFEAGLGHDNTIAYVSEFHARPKGGNLPIEVDESGRGISFDDYFQIDEHVIRALGEFCRTHGLKVKVLARWNSLNQENEYFQKNLGASLGVIVQRKEWFTNYVEMSKSKFTVTVDSTLGYEALSLGLKALCVSARAESYNTPSHRFGWPLEFEVEGSCWQNSWSEENFREKLEYLNSVSIREFAKSIDPRVVEVISPNCDMGPFLQTIEKIMHR